MPQRHRTSGSGFQRVERFQTQLAPFFVVLVAVESYRLQRATVVVVRSTGRVSFTHLLCPVLFYLHSRISLGKDRLISLVDQDSEPIPTYSYEVL
jgi:hypothetical protein